MKIYVFTIRDKKTGELIFAEGAQHDEYYSSFQLDKKWLTDEEANNGAWWGRDGKYSFDEEVRHLCSREYEKINFELEEIDFEKKEMKSFEDFEKKIFSMFNHEESQMEINFNTQKGSFETVEEWLKEPYANNWVSEEEKNKAIESNRICELQVYPRSPTSSYCIAASSLNSCLKYITDQTLSRR